MVLSGCGKKDVINHNYNFYGENDDWKASLIYEAKEVFRYQKDGTLDYENEDRHKFNVIYKGDLSDLSGTKHLEYGYETSHSGFNSTVNYEESGPSDIAFSSQSGGKGSALIQKDEIITVTIYIDGEIQTFEIRTK
jgi:hypothetical protein